jgi:hypothetical protein
MGIPFLIYDACARPLLLHSNYAIISVIGNTPDKVKIY